LWYSRILEGLSEGLMKPRRRRRRWVVAVCLCLLVSAPLLQALQNWQVWQRVRQHDAEEVPIPGNADEETEYYFVRLAYQSGPYARRWRQAWMTDSPAADRHFLQGVRRLTNIHARSLEVYLRPLDEKLFNYPWVYAVEVGQWYLNEDEAARLR